MQQLECVPILRSGLGEKDIEELMKDRSSEYVYIYYVIYSLFACSMHYFCWCVLLEVMKDG